MKPDFESIKVWAIKNKALTIGGLLLLLLIVVGFFGWLFGAFENWRNWRYINNLNANINAARSNANQVNENLANLVLQNVNAQINVNLANVNYQNSIKEHDEEKVITNQFIDNANRIRNANYSGSNTTTANAARCRAYPCSDGCPKSDCR